MSSPSQSKENIQENTLENQAVISNLSHDGRGVISNNGKKVLIDGVLPGETVNWQYTKRHRRFDEARVTDVITASEHRVAAQCPNFLVCGGCSYQHISSDQQLGHKQAIVQEMLLHIGEGVTAKKWLPPLQAKSLGYRTKARLGIKYVYKKEKILIGFREKSSSFITDMTTCKVLHPELDNLFQPLSDLIASLSIYSKIPQVEYAMGDYDNNILGRNIALILRHLEEFTSNDHEKLLQFAKVNNINLLLQPKGPDTVHCIYGTDDLYYYFNYQNDNNDLNIKFNFHPQDFTQVNLDINKLMLGQAIELLNLNGINTVLDLFCGLGNFSLPIARLLAHKNNSTTVNGIEGCNKMVARAEQNAVNNNIDNISFKCMDLYNSIDQDKILLDSNGNPFDCVILDPPRSGAKELLPVIAKSKIKKILYVSCDPATFARDVGVLCNTYKYKLDSVGIMDMFPHTKHVETMGLLVK